jgi:predicted nucleic acid-binding protein
VILVDSSVWIDHLNGRGEVLLKLLLGKLVLGHPSVAGEIAMGRLKRRRDVLQMLSELPQAAVAQHEEVMRLIEEAELFGRGLNYVDAHLLAAVRLTPGSSLWTRDMPLLVAARQLALENEALH